MAAQNERRTDAKSGIPKPNILERPDETTDVILVVEGRELHANRAVLAHYSPVFRKMFFSDFKEKSEEKVPLPGKTYADMVLFFNTLFPRGPASSGQINDKNLLKLLAMGDEYQADEVKSKCQDYIGKQLATYFSIFHAFFNERGIKFTFPIRGDDALQGQQTSKKQLISKLFLYVQCCVQYGLPEHRDRLYSLLLFFCDSHEDIVNSDRYKEISDAAKVPLFELMCKRQSQTISAFRFK